MAFGTHDKMGILRLDTQVVSSLYSSIYAQPCLGYPINQAISVGLYSFLVSLDLVTLSFQLLCANVSIHIFVSTVSLFSPLLGRTLIVFVQRFCTTESTCLLLARRPKVIVICCWHTFSVRLTCRTCCLAACPTFLDTLSVSDLICRCDALSVGRAGVGGLLVH